MALFCKLLNFVYQPMRRKIRWDREKFGRRIEISFYNKKTRKIICADHATTRVKEARVNHELMISW